MEHSTRICFIENSCSVLYSALIKLFLQRPYARELFWCNLEIVSSGPIVQLATLYVLMEHTSLLTIYITIVNIVLQDFLYEGHSMSSDPMIFTLLLSTAFILSTLKVL